MAVCCCSLAGTDACNHCSQNPFATEVWTNTTVTTDHIEAKPFGNGIDVCPVCGKPSTIGKSQTNADRILAMSVEKLANQLVSEQYVAMKMVLTLLCQKLKDEEMLDEKEVKELFCNFENEANKKWGEMVKEKLDWLKAPADKEGDG